MRRRVRSKLMSMALTLTMAAGLLSGCGGNSVSEADKTTITIWHDKEDAVAEVLQKKLEETTGIEKVSWLTDDIGADIPPEIGRTIQRKSDKFTGNSRRIKRIDSPAV